MHSNTYFGDATTKLIETTISELEAGNEDNVLFHLKQLQTAYHPSYETRSDYRELVNQYAEDLSTAPHNSKPNGQRPPSSANRDLQVRRTENDETSETPISSTNLRALVAPRVHWSTGHFPSTSQPSLAADFGLLSLSHVPLARHPADSFQTSAIRQWPFRIP